MSDTEDSTLSKNGADAVYAQIPANFPRTVQLGAVPGVQQKVLAVEYKGRFYTTGCTPPELYGRWQHCKRPAVPSMNS